MLFFGLPDMRDFTLTVYKKLLTSLAKADYSFHTVEAFVQTPLAGRVIVLRHDVDRLPKNALVIAKIEKSAGIKASYYFRIVKESYDENIIRQIAELGHEIGYHYEDLSLCNGDYEAAIRHFELNLEKFRKIYPVKTICMHGSPMSKWDNRDVWKKYDYRDFGIIAESYFDIDYNQVFYITDTGRMWNNASSSVRDRVESGFDITIQNTSHLIAFANQKVLPRQIMINTHPQRWTDKPLPWVKELVWQNVKNVVKRIIIRRLR